jgi:hypothetical protein
MEVFEMLRDLDVKVKVVLFCLVGVVVAVVLSQVSAGPAKQPEGSFPIAKWQHLALTEKVGVTQVTGQEGSTAELSRQIVKLGAEGWELVSVANFSRDGTTRKTVYYFKRPF